MPRASAAAGAGIHRNLVAPCEKAHFVAVWKDPYDVVLVAKDGSTTPYQHY